MSVSYEFLNLKNIKMKKILLFISITLCSCGGSESVTITEKDPFIVESISIYNEGYYVYGRNSFRFTFKEILAPHRQRIVLKNRNKK